MQLQARLGELEEAHQEYLKVEKDLERLKGSEQAVMYIAYGKRHGDGNHAGMKDHTPSWQGGLFYVYK